MLNSTNPETESKKIKEFSQRPFYAGFLFFAAVLLPVVAFTIEIGWGWCAETFFDPMPTWWHILLVAFVPITNFQIWWAVKNHRTERAAWLGFANALAIFISLFYTIVYAPLFPLAVIALAFFFLGILAMTPMFALLGTTLLRRELNKLASGENSNNKSFGLSWRGIGAALATTLIFLSVAELPFTLTRVGMKMAASENPQKQAEGLQFLRRWGNDDYLLRNCYWDSGKITTDAIGDFIAGRTTDFGLDEQVVNKNLRPEEVRKIYYRLHGKQYSLLPMPRGASSWERANATDASDELEATDNRLTQGLSVSGSQIDGSVDGDAALAYLEWTLTFKNEKSWQQEAVSQIQLPPNSVVSRLTLWINNEEREAAFAGRERVAQAYESVVSKRRDPVLVTTAGRDRISVKAFPVPPNGEMKVRIGITVPLYLENENSSLLVLPYFNQRNFAVLSEHAVWIESKKPLEIRNPAFTLESKDNLFAVRGKISNIDLVKTGAAIRTVKSSDVKTAWARVGKDSGEIVQQEIVESADAKFANLVFVVDANAKMKDFQKEIAAAIQTLPANVKTSLVLTDGNGFNLETAAPHSFAGNPNEVAAKIETATFDGGTDSVAALEHAWDLTETMPESAIVWIHASQPLELSSADALKQRFMRRPKSSLVYSLQTTNGANAVEKKLDGFGKVRAIPRFGNCGDDLKNFLARLSQNQPTFVVVREMHKKQTDLPKLANAKETSAHLVRLWANEEVSRLLENNEDKNALDLSVKYQLVTPVSGAVVLETAAQYEQFGLKPVEAGTVPTIPEPEEYLLFAVVIMILGWFGWQYRKKCKQIELIIETELFDKSVKA